MATDNWILEAIERSGSKGATLRDIQRFIDDHHYEELAVDTIKTTLDKLSLKGQVNQEVEHWKLSKRTNKEDALKKLFGD